MKHFFAVVLLADASNAMASTFSSGLDDYYVGDVKVASKLVEDMRRTQEELNITDAKTEASRARHYAQAVKNASAQDFKLMDLTDRVAALEAAPCAKSAY